MLRRTTASPRPASGAGVRSMRARPATSATRSRRPAAKWPNASSAGASNTARCARPNIEASQPSLPTSCSISSPTISCAFPSSSPPEAESARKPENRFRQTEIQQQRTETAWLPQVFQRTARADCGGRLFTAKLAVVVHYLADQLLDDRPRHTLQRLEAPSRGSVASTVGRVQRFQDSIAQARSQSCEPSYP